MIQGLLSAKEFGKNKIGEEKVSQFKDLPSNLKRKVSNFAFSIQENISNMIFDAQWSMRKNTKTWKHDWKKMSNKERVIRSSIRAGSFGRLRGGDYLPEGGGFKDLDYRQLGSHALMMQLTNGWITGQRHIGKKGKLDTEKIKKDYEYVKNHIL
jgi:hypothetical protein